MRLPFQRVQMKRILICALVALPSFAGDPWRTPLTQWTQQDAAQILNSSPWAKPDGRIKAVVRWDSARPVQLAIEKLNGKPTIADRQSHYAIAVVGLTVAAGSPKPEAYLRASGRNPIPSVETRILDNAITFFFPRTELLQPVVFRLPLGLKLGNDVEFAARIGALDVKKKFSLKSMTYLGKLEM
jgi:hypothetical protein